MRNHDYLLDSLCPILLAELERNYGTDIPIDLYGFAGCSTLLFERT